MKGQSVSEIRLKYAAHIEMGQSPPSTEYNDESSLPFLQGTADFGKEFPAPTVFCDTPNKVASAGDILFSVRAPVGEINLANQRCGIGRGLCAIRASSQFSTRFIWWALHEIRWQLNYVTTGSTYDAVSAEDVSNLYLPDNSFKNQQAIAEFLDRETEKIDALIAAKERLLGILSEKRRALISHAITRGLNPGLPFRDPGIPWLGEIPAHWETERARWLFKERDERSQTGDEELLTVSHLTGVTPRSEKNVNMFEAETTEGYKLCYAGDLVINTLWAWMGAMGVSPLDGIVSPAYNVYTPCKRLEPLYVDELVRIPVFAEEATRFSKGVWSSRLRLYPEGFFEIWMPVPPLEEQNAIVAYIKREAAKIDTMRKAIERTIVLSKERRAALIAAAVTGVMKISEH